MEPWIDIFVDVPILGPQLRAVVGAPLARELAVEDQDVPLLRAVISVKEHHDERMNPNRRFKWTHVAAS